MADTYLTAVEFTDDELVAMYRAMRSVSVESQKKFRVLTPILVKVRKAWKDLRQRDDADFESHLIQFDM